MLDELIDVSRPLTLTGIDWELLAVCVGRLWPTQPYFDRLVGSPVDPAGSEFTLTPSFWERDERNPLSQRNKIGALYLSAHSAQCSANL